MWGPRVTGPAVTTTLPASVRKIGLVSDAHGQAVALTEAMHHLREEGAETILFNGDALDYWGRCVDPRGTLAALRAEDAFCIEGNHDAWHAAHKEVDDAELCAWHDDWPFARRVEVNGTTIVQFHGGPNDIIHYTYAHAHSRGEFADMLRVHECDYLIFGHTHAPMCIETDLGFVINPGALAYVSTYDGRPSYALLDLDAHRCTHFDVYAPDAELTPLHRRYRL